MQQNNDGHSSCLLPMGRWFDVLQKVSTQLKTNLTSVTKNRADKVNGSWLLNAGGKVARCLPWLLETFWLKTPIRILSVLFIECHSQSHPSVRASGHQGAEAVHGDHVRAGAEAGLGLAGSAGPATG